MRAGGTRSGVRIQGMYRAGVTAGNTERRNRGQWGVRGQGERCSATTRGETTIARIQTTAGAVEAITTILR